MRGVQSTGEPPPERGGALTYTGRVTWEYRPNRDRDADPGEIVWAWVAFEEDARVGKDRPIVVIGRTVDDRLAALMLSSQSRAGQRGWLSLGSGPWDRDGRASFVRLDRILAVRPGAVRREGAVLPQDAFMRIAAAMGAVKPTRPPRARGGLVRRIVRLFRRSR